MLLLLPVRMNYQAERLPLVTFSLMGVNTLVYLVSLVCFFQTGGDSELWIYEHLWLIPSQSYFWTYLTSMFVHAGFFHLFGNMIFLFLFGACVEDMIGRWKFLGFYLIGGLIAEFTYIAMTRQHFASDIPMGGASGAISACMGMYLLLRAGAEIEFKYFFWFFVIRAGEFEIPAWVAITFWFLKDLFWAVMDLLSHDERHGGTAFGAHVGGLLAGLALIGVTKWIGRDREPLEPGPEFTQFALEQGRAFTPPASLVRPMAMNTTLETPAIYLHDGQEQTGPFTLTEVQAKLHRGEISHATQYWSEGMTDWQNVMELAEHPLS